MRIGVLALQGAFAEHCAMLKKLDAEPIEIRQLADLQSKIDGLVLPGGESTVMGKLLRDLHLLQPLKEAIENGLPVFGTCAGLILLAKKIRQEPAPGFCTMDIEVQRNGYGRQLGSFAQNCEVKGMGEFPTVFIRAPYIVSVGEEVEVLAQTEHKVTAAKQKNMLVTCFHPELTQDTRMHELFLKMILV